MSPAKQLAEQYLELFASEVYHAKENNRPIDENIWKNMVDFVTRGIQVNSQSESK